MSQFTACNVLAGNKVNSGAATGLPRDTDASFHLGRGKEIRADPTRPDHLVVDDSLFCNTDWHRTLSLGQLIRFIFTQLHSSIRILLDMAEVPVPFSEPPYALGLPVPWMTSGLQEWQQKCFKFVNEHLTKGAWDWEKEETVPEHVFETFAKHRMLIPSLPSPLPVRELKDAGIHDVLGVKVEDFTYWHNYIYGNEMLRSGLTGPSGSLTTGIAFGVPPIIKFGNGQLKKRFLPELLRGEKRTCIAITEPDAGSDVANIQTTAVKSKDGKKYIVNGTKVRFGRWKSTRCS